MIRLLKTILVMGIFILHCNPVISLDQNEMDEGFVSLFTGVDLAGWDIMGNEKAWKVEDGMIHALPGLNGGYIRSIGEFENFILRLEYKTGKDANSGVFIHIPRYGRESRVGGEIQIFDSFGKELSRHGAGAIYDVLPPLVNASKEPGTWHELEIYYEYPQLKVTLNGQVVQDLDLTGHERLEWRKRFGSFGLQEHGNHVWFRNVRVKDLGGNDRKSWKPLFNGKNLDGWHSEGETKWNMKPGKTILSIVNDGLIDNAGFIKDWGQWSALGRTKWKMKEPFVKGISAPGYFVSEKEYKDFHLWAYVKMGYHGDSSLYFRYKNKDDRGYRVKLLNDRNAQYKTGSLFDLVEASGLYSSNGDWFPLQVIVKGKETTVIVNGAVVAKYEETEDRAGHIAFRVDGRGTDISLKDLRIQEL